MAGGVIRESLGEAWFGLAPLVRRHFELDGGQKLELTGTMEVAHGGPGRLLFPVLGRLGVLVPYQGRDVPCRFESRMVSAGPGRCFERVRFNLAIRMRLACEDGALVFRDDGYFWHLGRWRVRVPMRWLMGALTVVEREEGEAIVVELALEHPWFGRVFFYCGRFAFPM